MLSLSGAGARAGGMQASASAGVAGREVGRRIRPNAATARMDGTQGTLGTLRHYASQSGGDSGDDAALLAGLPQRPSKPLTRAKLRRLRAAEGHAARVRGEYVEPQTGRYRQGWTDPKPEFRQCLRLAHALAKRWQDPYIFWSARAICRRTLLKAYEQPPESHAQDHRVFMRERSPQLVKARNAYKNLRERMRVYRKAWAGRRRDSQKLLEETYGRKGYLKHRLHNWLLERRDYPNPDVCPSPALLFCLKSPVISPTPLPDRFLPHDVPFPRVDPQGEKVQKTRKRGNFFRIMYDRMRFPLKDEVVRHIEEKSQAGQPRAAAGAALEAGTSSDSAASDPDTAAFLAQEDQYEEHDWLHELYMPEADEEHGGRYMRDAYANLARTTAAATATAAGQGQAQAQQPYLAPTASPPRARQPFQEPPPVQQPQRSRTGIPVPPVPTTAPADGPVVPGPLHPLAPHYARACRRMWARVLSITPIIGTGHPGTSLERVKARVGEAFAGAGAGAGGSPTPTPTLAAGASSAAQPDWPPTPTPARFPRKSPRGIQLEANYDVKIGRYHPRAAGLREVFFDEPTRLSESLVWSEYPPPHLLERSESRKRSERGKGESRSDKGKPGHSEGKKGGEEHPAASRTRTGWFEGPLWASETRLPTLGLRETYAAFAEQCRVAQEEKWAREDAERRGAGATAPAPGVEHSQSETEPSPDPPSSAPPPSPPLNIYFSPLALFPQGTGPTGPSSSASPPPSGATLRPEAVAVRVPYLAGRTKVKIASSAYVSLEEALWARRGARAAGKGEENGEKGKGESRVKKGRDGKRKERVV